MFRTTGNNSFTFTCSQSCGSISGKHRFSTPVTCSHAPYTEDSSSVLSSILSTFSTFINERTVPNSRSTVCASNIFFTLPFSSYTFKVNFTLSASICKIPAHFMPGSLIIHCLFTFFVPYAVFAFTLSGVWTVSKNVLPSTRSSPISTFTAFAVFPVLVNLWVVEIPVYVIS